MGSTYLGDCIATDHVHTDITNLTSRNYNRSTALESNKLFGEGGGGLNMSYWTQASHSVFATFLPDGNNYKTKEDI